MKSLIIALATTILMFTLTGCTALELIDSTLETIYGTKNAIENFTDKVEWAVKEFEEVAKEMAEEKSAEVKSELYGPYDVIRVVDGDTLVADIDGEKMTVRMIGVDTPESVHPDDSKNSPEGEEASAWTKALLTDTQIYLEYDVDKDDDYGRTLAYVYLDDQETMVQRLLLEEGMAQVMTIQPNSKYANEFVLIQSSARQDAAGFWEDAWTD